MARKQWLFVAPALLLVGGGGWKLAGLPARAPDGRIVHPEALSLERQLGRHLYAPSWLPTGARPGMVREGRHRVLFDYQDPTERSLFIVAQEPRNDERDAYHAKRFVRPSDSRAPIDADSTGYFITGTSGERRLFWHTADTSVILSSTMLGDEDLVRLAQSFR